MRLYNLQLANKIKIEVRKCTQNFIYSIFYIHFIEKGKSKISHKMHEPDQLEGFNQNSLQMNYFSWITAEYGLKTEFYTKINYSNVKIIQNKSTKNNTIENIME